MTPSLRDLEYFLEVAGTASISRAAERVGISQPSLSLAIQRLEESIGSPLLVRSKSGVTLTPSGKRLAERAQRLCDDWRRLRDYTVAAEHEVAGSYVIGCHTTVAAYSLPLCLPELLQRHPGLDVSLVHDLSRKIVEAVISERVDVGIVINPIRHPDLVIRRLCSDQVTLWRAAQASPLQVTDGKGVLICDTYLAQTQALLRQLGAANHHFGRVIESASLEVIGALTAKGCGIGILPSRAAIQHALVPVADAPVFEDELCAVYRVENKHVPAIGAIATAVARAMEPGAPTCLR